MQFLGRMTLKGVKDRCNYYEFVIFAAVMERKQITFDTFVRGMLAVAAMVGIVMLFKRLSGALVPFFLAWLLAYLLFPVVKFFQFRCHLKYRIVAILLTFLIVGSVLSGVFMLMIPPMISEGARVADLIVQYVQTDETFSSIPQLVQQFVRENVDIEQLKKLVTQDGFIEVVQSTLPKVWDIIAQSISILSSFFSLTMVVLYTLFILLDYEEITEGWPGLLPSRYRPFAKQLVADVTNGMNKYFRGQALVAFCVGVLFSIGFLIIGFPMAVALGMFIGLLNMVPYLQLVGFLPTIILAIVKAADTGQSFWIVMLMALAVFAVVQTIQDTVLTPKIMGKAMGLNSAIILLSLSIWGSLLGILGMIIALPMTTLIISYYQRCVLEKE